MVTGHYSILCEAAKYLKLTLNTYLHNNCNVIKMYLLTVLSTSNVPVVCQLSNINIPAQYLYLPPRLQASVEKVVMEARDKAVEAVKLR